MRRLKGKMEVTFDGFLPPEIGVGHDHHSDIMLDSLDCRISIFYRVTEETPDGKHKADIRAIAFSTSEEYRRFISSGAKEGDDGPDVYVAEDDELVFLSKTRIPEGACVSNYLPDNIDLATGERTSQEYECIVTRCVEQPDGSFRVHMKPYDLHRKRRMLVAARMEPWLTVNGVK
ncbi:MAG: hypothetical protein FJY76_02310 [Candidatus Aenigmarchaeota archaeon]|nr:hypothetical protein [Candidatus Aenigmarchaeota archaeon]